jgi:MscS family membrane protein
MRLHLIFIWTLLLAGVAFGQDVVPTDPPTNGETPVPKRTAIDPGYASPQATMFTFINAMNDCTDARKAGNAAARKKALNKAVSTLNLTDATSERGQVLAERLMITLNRLGEFQSWFLWGVDESEARAEQTYFPHGRFDKAINAVSDVEPNGAIVLKKQPDSRWLFSADTVANLDDLFRSLEPLPILVGPKQTEIGGEGWLRQRMPVSLKQNTLLSVEYWQWVGLLGLIFLGVAVDHISRLIIRMFATRFIRARDVEPDPIRMREFVRPTGLLLMAVFWLSTLWLIELPGLAYAIVHGAARVFTVWATAWALWRLTDLVTDALIRKAEKTETKIDDVVYPMVRTSLRIFIVVFGIIYGGLALNINIWPAVTAVGIGSLGFAFAAKDTLENFFGSATVLIDRPFSVGDWVVIDDVEGTVEQIGFRSTRVRTFYNSLITVPNANLVRAAVDNYGARRYRRWKTLVGVEYGTPPEKVVAFCEGIRELVRTHPYTRKDYFQVWLNQFGPSSLDILVYVFHETPDWSTELRERERLMLDMMRLADKLEVAFAFPTQTLHVFNEEQVGQHTPADTPTSLTDKRAMVDGIRTVHDLISNQTWQSEKPGPVEYKFGPTNLDSEDDTQIEQRGAGG